jgi:hypothetical protein
MGTLSDTHISKLLTSDLTQLRDVKFLRDTFLIGHPESPHAKDVARILEARSIVDRVDATSQTARLMREANSLLRWYTLLTALIAIFTGINIAIEIWRSIR